MRACALGAEGVTSLIIHLLLYACRFFPCLCIFHALKSGVFVFRFLFSYPVSERSSRPCLPPRGTGAQYLVHGLSLTRNCASPDKYRNECVRLLTDGAGEEGIREGREMEKGISVEEEIDKGAW